MKILVPFVVAAMAICSGAQARCNVEIRPLGVNHVHSIDCPSVDDQDLPRAIAEVVARVGRPVNRLVLLFDRYLMSSANMPFDNITILANTE